VELALGGDRTGLEWQMQIDGAPWSGWTRFPSMLLSQDGFWLQGKHAILVRARAAGQPETTDDTPVELTAIIDSIAPTVALSDQGDAIRIEAEDRVSAAEDLVVDYRFGDGAWQKAAAPPVSIALGEDDDPSSFVARVTDQAGNVVLTTGTEAGFHGRAPSTGSGCNCRVGSGRGGAPRGVWLVGALGFLGVIVVRRRKSRARALPFAVLALAAFVAVAASACGGDAPGGDDDDMIEPGLQPGAIGRYLDMAAEGDRVVVVGYEDKYGDLVLSDVDGDGKVKLKPVDGVPAGAPATDVPTGYRGGVSAEGENVGAYASVALIDGKAHVAYQHIDDGTLLYGSENGDAWDRHVVDAAEGGGFVGLYNSLSVDASGVPGIAYLATAVPDGAGGFKSQLRWAQAASTSPAATSDWSVSVVAEGSIPCAGLCDDSQFACVKSSNTCQMIESTCAAACGDGKACISATCVDVVAAPVAEDLPDGPGLFASAARLPSGDPVVAFYDRTSGDLKLATFSAGTWTVSNLAVETATDMGQWASLIVGGDGTLRVAFQDALGDTLRYLEVSNGSVSAIEMVDSGLRDDRPHPVGAAATLFFDAGGQLGVLYQDAATNDLLLGRRDASGTWSHTELMVGPIGYGFYNAAAVSGGKTWVATFGYDREKFPPGEVIVQALP
jgi:MYXO-CTERM domain-containing protein